MEVSKNTQPALKIKIALYKLYVNIIPNIFIH